MNEYEKIGLPILVIFAAVAVIVFRKRRWQGALGWVMIGGAFILSVLRSRTPDPNLLASIISALVIVAGIGLAGYDYIRYERPRRRQRQAERLAAGHVPMSQRLRRKNPLRRRRHK